MTKQLKEWIVRRSGSGLTIVGVDPETLESVTVTGVDIIVSTGGKHIATKVKKEECWELV